MNHDLLFMLLCLFIFDSGILLHCFLKDDKSDYAKGKVKIQSEEVIYKTSIKGDPLTEDEMFDLYLLYRDVMTQHQKDLIKRNYADSRYVSYKTFGKVLKEVDAVVEFEGLYYRRCRNEAA